MSNKKITIPVVFSTNDKYALYCYLAIFSLLKYADKKNYYDIRIFMVSLSQDHIQLLESLTKDYATVTCMNVTSYVKDADLRELSFFTAEAFYRLFISKVLPQYKKVIYFDSDMLILQDITPLFYIQMNGHPIAAVHDIVCFHLDEHAKDLGLDIKNMFNSGVMVIDTEVYDRKNIREIGLRILEDDYKNKKRKFIYVDQDVLNITAYNDVEFLDDRWNFQFEFLWRLDSLDEKYKENYKRTSLNPWIIHFAGDRKPWSYPSLPYADYFWNMAMEAGITKKVIEASIQIERENKDLQSCFQSFRFPYESVKAGSRVAIYAAGNVGQDFVKQLDNTLFAKVLLWVDKQYEKKYKELKVVNPEQLVIYKNDFDYLIIAIDDEKIALQVKEYLKQLDIPNDKIVWKNYRRCDYE